MQSHRTPDVGGTSETILARFTPRLGGLLCFLSVSQGLLKSRGNLPATGASCLERMQKSSVQAKNKTVYFIKQKSVVKVQGNSYGSRRELCGKSPPGGLYDIPGRESPRVQKADSGGTLGFSRSHGLVIITNTFRSSIY